MAVRSSVGRPAVGSPGDLVAEAVKLGGGILAHFIEGDIEGELHRGAEAGQTVEAGGRLGRSVLFRRRRLCEKSHRGRRRIPGPGTTRYCRRITRAAQPRAPNRINRGRRFGRPRRRCLVRSRLLGPFPSATGYRITFTPGHRLPTKPPADRRRRDVLIRAADPPRRSHRRHGRKTPVEHRTPPGRRTSRPSSDPPPKFGRLRCPARRQ